MQSVMHTHSSKVLPNKRRFKKIIINWPLLCFVSSSSFSLQSQVAIGYLASHYLENTLLRIYFTNQAVHNLHLYGTHRITVGITSQAKKTLSTARAWQNSRPTVDSASTKTPYRSETQNTSVDSSTIRICLCYLFCQTWDLYVLLPGVIMKNMI